MSDQTISVSGTVDAFETNASTGGFVDANASFASEPQCLSTDIVTVKATGRSAYTYCVRAARRFRRFITVKARAFAAVIESRVRAFLINVFPKTGADILRQSAILIS